MRRSGMNRTSGSGSNEAKERTKGCAHAVQRSPFWLSSGLVVWQRKHEGISSSASVKGRPRTWLGLRLGLGLGLGLGLRVRVRV